jgi:uncharacterized membrane protein YedE/YeeE
LTFKSLYGLKRMITEFTPIASGFGGILIGVASVLLMLTLGRVMGATGILAGFIAPSEVRDWGWRAALLGGMMTAPLVYSLLTGSGPQIQVPVSNTMLIIGGLIVGVGVTFGGGCTSGHGVCGMARLSTRSIVATIVFMISTGLTVYLVRHVLGG